MNHIVVASLMTVDSKSEDLNIPSTVEYKNISFESDDVLYLHEEVFQDKECCCVMFRNSENILVGETMPQMFKKCYGIQYPKDK